MMAAAISAAAKTHQTGVIGVGAVAQGDGREDEARQQLHRRISQRDAGAAGGDSARAAHRYESTGMFSHGCDRVAAVRAARSRTHQRFAARQAVDHDVQERSHDQPKTSAMATRPPGLKTSSKLMRSA